MDWLAAESPSQSLQPTAMVARHITALSASAASLTFAVAPEGGPV
jgi:hypothetical protein